jgi:hypothetical protein
VRSALIRAAVATLGLGLTVGGCTLLGLDEFELSACRDDSDCRDAFNAEQGFYADCAAFVCDTSGGAGICKPVAGEICDGLDNDCDYVVDEPNGEVAVVTASFSELATGVPQASSATVANSQGFRSIYLQRSDSEAVVAIDPDSGESQDVRFRSNSSEENGRDITLVDDCRIEPDGAIAMCAATDSAVTAGSTMGFFATVNPVGCASGELRLGVIDPADRGAWLQRGPTRRSPTYRGVDSNAARCTASGTTACETAVAAFEGDPSAANRQSVIQNCGASRPALAAQDDHALMAFLGGPTPDSCGGSSKPIRALMVHGRSGEFGETFIWADASNEGIPESIGTTRGGAAPAVISWTGGGFIVGHGDDSGQQRLVWVPQQAAPPVNSGIDCTTQAECSERTGVEIPALAGVAEIGVLEGSAGTVDGVTLSLVPALASGNGESVLGMAWWEGCNESGGEVFFRLLRLGESVAGAPPTLLSTTAPVSVGRSSSPPLLQHAADGFLAPGFERGGLTASAEAESGAGTTGGFYVIIHADQGPRAVRLAVLDGALVDEGEGGSLVLGTDQDQVLASGSELLVRRGQGASLETGALGCAAPTTP